MKGTGAHTGSPAPPVGFGYKKTCAVAPAHSSPARLTDSPRDNRRKDAVTMAEWLPATHGLITFAASPQKTRQLAVLATVDTCCR